MEATGLTSLPREILYNIRYHIHNLQSHVNFSLTCRLAYDLYDDRFWKFACLALGWGLSQPKEERGSASNFRFGMNDMEQFFYDILNMADASEEYSSGTSSLKSDDESTNDGQPSKSSDDCAPSGHETMPDNDSSSELDGEKSTCEKTGTMTVFNSGEEDPESPRDSHDATEASSNTTHLDDDSGKKQPCDEDVAKNFNLWAGLARLVVADAAVFAGYREMPFSVMDESKFLLPGLFLPLLVIVAPQYCTTC